MYSVQNLRARVLSGTQQLEYEKMGGKARKRNGGGGGGGVNFRVQTFQYPSYFSRAYLTRSKQSKLQGKGDVPSKDKQSSVFKTVHLLKP